MNKPRYIYPRPISGVGAVLLKRPMTSLNVKCVCVGGGHGINQQ